MLYGTQRTHYLTAFWRNLEIQALFYKYNKLLCHFGPGIMNKLRWLFCWSLISEHDVPNISFCVCGHFGCSWGFAWVAKQFYTFWCNQLKFDSYVACHIIRHCERQISFEQTVCLLSSSTDVYSFSRTALINCHCNAIHNALKAVCTSTLYLFTR